MEVTAESKLGSPLFLHEHRHCLNRKREVRHKGQWGKETTEHHWQHTITKDGGGTHQLDAILRHEIQDPIDPYYAAKGNAVHITKVDFAGLALDR